MNNKVLSSIICMKYAAVFLIMFWYLIQFGCCENAYNWNLLSYSDYGYVCDGCYDLMETINLDSYM